MHLLRAHPTLFGRAAALHFLLPRFARRGGKGARRHPAQSPSRRATAVADGDPMIWDLRLGSCVERVFGLESLPDASVDHVITDPPYSAHLYTRTRTNKGRFGDRSKSAFDLASLRIGAIDDLLDPVAAEIMRLTRRWAIVFSDVEIAPRWRAAFGDWYVRTGAWIKTNPMPQVSGDRPAQGFEACTIAHRPGRKRWNGGGRAAVWIDGNCQGPDRPDHPCPKPLGLMRALVADFTDRGELICDPFAGSGTTLVAAVQAGRRAIGWELDSHYCKIARQRLEDTREQLELEVKPARAQQLRLALGGEKG